MFRAGGPAPCTDNPDVGSSLVSENRNDGAMHLDAANDIAREAERAATKDDVADTVIVHGGDTSAAFRMETRGGRTLFAKTHPSPPERFFTTEAASLGWLAECNEVRVPTVIAASDGVDGRNGYLLLDWIEQDSTPPDERAFGRSLAALHATGAPSFGRADRHTTGSLGLPNRPTASWSEFVATCRFEPLAQIARERRSLPLDVIVELERLASSLDRFDDGEPPSRLHGDLWAGNRLVDAHGESWLIDPAAHGGHRESDLSMMRLFGGFGSSAFAAYEEVSPLADGWQDRIELHQIAPLVVHAIKFGGSYVAASTSAITRYT